MSFWNVALIVAAAAVVVPMLVWSLECAAALFPPRKKLPTAGARRPSVAVLVPAHNEAGGIRRTLEGILAQIEPGDRLLVIADNCTDGTAEIARQAGANVVERHDDLRLGKSYAIDCGVQALGESSEAVVVIDADCAVHPAAIDCMARLAFASGRPVQATYLLELPPDPDPQHHMAALAFRIRNEVRPAGLDRLGLPCFLNGSGMAFPASVLRSAPLDSGRIAEDRWLTVDLSLAGHVPLFCRDAGITGRLPSRRQAGASQRTRWLHGHLECMLSQAPRLLLGAIRQGRIDLLALALDLFVPPLSLLIVLWLAVSTAAVTAGLLGAGWKLTVLPAVGAMSMAVALGAVLFRFGRRQSATSLLAAPSYVLARLPIYLAFLSRRQKNWVRTERDSDPTRE